MNLLQGDEEQLRMNHPGLRNDPRAFHFGENKLISRKEAGVNIARENAWRYLSGQAYKEMKVQLQDRGSPCIPQSEVCELRDQKI